MSKIEKSIIINAPVAECYTAWSTITNFPQFMEHIESVTSKSEPNMYHWKAKSIMGMDLAWDAKWQADETNRRISWETANEDSDNTTDGLEMSGQVGFADLGDHKTQVSVLFNFNPPAGPIGEAFAKIFKDPDNMVDTDLKNFKHFVERQPATV